MVGTRSRLLLLPPTKMRQITSGASRLLKKGSRHRRHVCRRDVQRFAWLANSAAPALLDCRLRLRKLFKSLSPAHPAERVERRKSLQRREPQATAAEGVEPPAKYPLTTQSSATPPCATCNGGRDSQSTSTRGAKFGPSPQHACSRKPACPVGVRPGRAGSQRPAPLAPRRRAPTSTNWSLAPRCALHTFLPFARQKHVKLVTDSLVTAHIVRNMTSRSPRLLSKLRLFHAMCERYGITVST